MKEADYLTEVYRICKDAGVSYHHCKDSRSCEGKGLPDLTIVGTRGVLWREVKSDEYARPTSEQTAWLWVLISAGQDARIWGPTDLLCGMVAFEISQIA